MALYLGSSKQLKIYLGDSSCHLNLYSKIPITNGIRLLSLDDYALLDSNGVYLTVLDSVSKNAICGQAICGEIICGGVL